MDAIITKLKKTENAYQFELTEKIEISGATPLTRYNASDDRFKISKHRYAWLTIQPEDFHKDFPFFSLTQAKALKVGEHIELNIKNPRTPDGLEIHLQIEETLYGNDYQIENKAKMSKQMKIDAGILKSGIKYIQTDGVVGQCISKYIMDNAQEVLDQKGYFVTENGLPVFVNTKVVFGKPNHTKINDLIFVHFSELEWAKNIDLTENNDQDELEEEEIASKETAVK